MTEPRERKPIDDWGGKRIPLGASKDVQLAIGESYSSRTVQIPMHVIRGPEEGPVVFITAALHGDEINGTGVVHGLIRDEAFQLLRGSLILVPVLNLLAFERHSRYLPDRRDLNRAFPGSHGGSLAGRMARKIFEEIVQRSDYGVDLHTAAVRRTNYPNVRADLTDPEVARLARSFGCEILINAKGPAGSLRREACLDGCPTIIMEGGEVWKVEPRVVESGRRGIENVLRELGMLAGEIDSPPYQVVIEKSKWIRAELGGFLQFHVRPGEVVQEGQPLASNTTLLGRDRSILVAPFDGVVIGMTTLPAISPGEPVCHIGRLPKGTQPKALRRRRSREDGLEERLSEELASSVLVVEAPDTP
jgi:predicted deacylase